MASRERCPFLIRVEVADTNLRGNDSRLYASGALGIGATIEEALAMSSACKSTVATNEANPQDHVFGNCRIPPELLAPISCKPKKSRSVEVANESVADAQSKEMPRGGWQANETMFYSHNPEDVFSTNPYDRVRENEYHQLHQQMYNNHGMVAQSPPSVVEQRYVFVFHTIAKWKY